MAELEPWQIAFRNSVYEIFDIPKPLTLPPAEPRSPTATFASRQSGRTPGPAPQPFKPSALPRHSGPTRACPDCIWFGPTSEYCDHRMMVHAR
jgi:hypothetical protein